METDRSGGGSPGTSVPPCGRCGRARRFEFQVQPQLLHYLCKGGHDGVASGAINMEWGTVAVYTCSGSCELDPDQDAKEPPYLPTSTLDLALNIYTTEPS